MRFAKEYRVLDVDLGAGGASQCILLKEHSDRTSNNAKDRTLFLGNIDYGRELDSGEVEAFIADFFSSFGNIESVSLSHFKKEVGSTRNTRFAHVIFDKKKTLKLVMQATDQMYADINNNLKQNWGLEVIHENFGSSDILDMYMLKDTDPVELQLEVDTIMADFELGEKAAIEERERKLLEADADGFMMVKPRKKRKRVEATSSRRGSGGPRTRKKKTYELKNFYSHQKREEKREKLYELRQKFEEDKEKVAAMKEARKFKPF